VKLEVASITNQNAASLVEKGLAAIGAGDTVIDLAGVEAVDSAAVALLLSWQRAASQQGKRLTFRNVPPGISSLAELYDVDTLLEVGASQG
jgi:phospholipid transport system transporter-binding protein